MLEVLQKANLQWYCHYGVVANIEVPQLEEPRNLSDICEFDMKAPEVITEKNESSLLNFGWTVIEVQLLEVCHFMVMVGTSLTSFSAENVTPDLVSIGADWLGLPSSLLVDRCFRRVEAPASLCLFSSESSQAVSDSALVVQGDSKHFPSMETKCSILELVFGYLNQKLLLTINTIMVGSSPPVTAGRQQLLEVFQG
ncbi:hypothetical protein F7725_028273 [Dissostichus mawsoni]|uniref:Uncharacterized protein n=1 Tax=Dissostichus mawsoni TaxID=36200 RepID=A0A7J5XF82_DISMA|nr:hypothetical protein F7725_028273 [Dissostichus mawsoni]